MSRRRIKPLLVLLLLPLLMAASAKGCAPPQPSTGAPPGPVNNEPASIFSPSGGVYIELFDRKITYVGSGDLRTRIAKNLAKYPERSYRVLIRVDPSKTSDPGLTEDGIEQTAINYYKADGMPLRNQVAAIAKSNRYYDRAMELAKQYIDKYGWEEDASDPLNVKNPDDPGSEDVDGFDDFPDF